MNKVRVEKSVCVITPTIGEDAILYATESVRRQTYGNVTHLIVADGPVYADKLIGKFKLDDNKYVFTTAPYNTGANGYYGHRIYAAYPHLIDHDYVCFLDADNWFEPNHIESLVSKIEKDGLDWAYSLRNVYLQKDKFLAKDCCESIGKWPIWFTIRDAAIPQYLVDTSSYCFKREFLINVCNYWHSGWGGDRRFLYIITKQLGHTNYDTTGLHTLNYVLPDMDKAYGGDLEFFAKGNEAVEQYYGGKYPWLKT